MPDNSQFQKVISVLLIFILITELPACVSTVKFIPVYDVPIKDGNPSRNAYVVCGLRSHHFPKYKAYIVKNISISNGYLIADRDKGRNRPWTYYTIFVASDSLIKVASDESVKIALDDIYKVKVEEINWYRFWAYAAVGIVTFSILLALIFGDPHNGNKI